MLGVCPLACLQQQRLCVLIDETCAQAVWTIDITHVIYSHHRQDAWRVQALVYTIHALQPGSYVVGTTCRPHAKATLVLTVCSITCFCQAAE